MKEQKKQNKEKSKKRVSIKIILSFLIVLIIGWFVGYYLFEVYRLGQYNINLFKDWRSYTAFLISKVPYLNRYVKYEPMRVLTVEEFYKEQFLVYQKRLEEQSEELRKKAEELKQFEKNIEEEKEKLEQLRGEVEREKKDLEKEKAEWTNYKNRLKTLSDWLASADPAKIVPAIAEKSVSVELLVDALRMLSSDTAAEILQALSNIDPKKAADVLVKLGSKEVGK